VTPGELLAANPQFSGNGRTPNRIFPGEAVTIPEETQFSKDMDLKRGRMKCASDCPSMVRFTDPSTDQRCRWNPTGAVPWKTLVSGQSGQVTAEISPPAKFACVTFESTAPGVAKVSPAAAASAVQTLTLEALSRGDTEVRAVCDGNTIATFAVKVLAFTLPMLVAKSRRAPGLNADGTVAADMLFGDYSRRRIENIGFPFKVSQAVWNLDSVKATTLFQIFRNMARNFSMGDLETNILAMIDRFEANTGGTYSNPKLTDAVRRHASTGRFIDDIRNQLAVALNKHQGDISKFSAPRELRLSGQPHFSEPIDIITGLTIAINDTWAYDVVLEEYRLVGDRCYSGKFKVILWDHFGLDEPDVDGSKPYAIEPGFRAWFILQHLTRLGYKPFLTEIVLDGYEFHGCFAQ